jgi:organic radical activating enzyme
MVNYPVHEMFHTFQGEGVYMGVPAFFVRLFGCPVHCNFCDSSGTWHPDHIPSNIQRLSADEIAKRAKQSGAPLVVVTGGEPTIHDLRELCGAVWDNHMAIHLETCGAFPIKGDFDWITLSPKKWKPPIQENLALAHEFKLIIEEPADIAFYSKMIKMGAHDYSHVWLHPEWSQRNNPVVLRAIVDAVKQGGGRYRAGWQIHKCFGVDQFDPGSRPLVPLGGDPKKGF